MLRTALIGFVLLAVTAAPSAAQTASTPVPAPAPAASVSPSPAPSPTPTPVPPWTFTGYFDGTYTTPTSNGGTFLFTNGSNARVFDFDPHRFVPNNFNFNLKKNTTSGLGGNLEISLGSDANVIASYGGSGFGPTGNLIDVTQAYLYYATGPFTLDVGKFETLAGAEVIEAPGNSNISRSILFGYAIPFTHTGVRLVFAPNAKISLTAGANYGWDTMKSVNGLSTLEAGLALTPSSAISFNANFYSGKTPVLGYLTPLPTGTRTLVDLVAKWTAGSALTFTLNYDTASQANGAFSPVTGLPIGSAKWSGLAGYATYTVNPHWQLGGRLESFQDSQGYRTGIAQTWTEGTATLQYTPTASNWKVRGEYRSDSSNLPVFARFTSPVGTSTKTNSSLGLEVIYTWP